MVDITLKAAIQKIVSDAYLVSKKKFPDNSTGFIKNFFAYLENNKNRIERLIAQEGKSKLEVERVYEELIVNLKLLLQTELKENLKELIASIQLKFNEMLE